MWGGLIFLSRVVIRPRLQKTSSSTFWVVLLSGHIIKAKMILPGAHCLNMLRDYVKKNCCPRAFGPCNTPSGSYTATWVESLNSANQAASNNEEHVSHSGDQRKQMDCPHLWCTFNLRLHTECILKKMASEMRVIIFCSSDISKALQSFRCLWWCRARTWITYSF